MFSIALSSHAQELSSLLKDYMRSLNLSVGKRKRSGKGAHDAASEPGGPSSTAGGGSNLAQAWQTHAMPIFVAFPYFGPHCGHGS